MRNQRYEYKPSYERTATIAENRSTNDPLFKEVKTFKAREGDNLVRILPPGWENADHYGLPVKIHRDVGPENRAYLCLRQKGSPYKNCPICDELYRLGHNATAKDKQLLKARDNVLFYIIDREAEKEGVQLWLTSPSRAAEIAAQTLERRSRTILNITDPENGYDIEFRRTGTGLNTKYTGMKVVREPSPLSDNDKLFDQWLDTAYETSLPQILNFYSPEHIKEVFFGSAADEDESPRRRLRDVEQPSEEEDELERPLTRRRGRIEEEEETSRSRRTRPSLQEDLDDEVPPFDGGKPMKKDEEQVEERPQRRSRVTLEEEPQERPRRSSRVEEDDSEGEEETISRRRRSRGTSDNEETATRDRSTTVERMRRRLDRSSVAEDEDC